MMLTGMVFSEFVMVIFSPCSFRVVMVPKEKKGGQTFYLRSMQAICPK
jgi:hypothetical protein